jgi:hypothetical protein
MLGLVDHREGEGYADFSEDFGGPGPRFELSTFSRNRAVSGARNL